MNLTTGYSLSNPQFVEANRRGEIDPGQRATLQQVAGWWAGSAGLVFPLIVLPLMCVGVLAVIFFVDTRREAPLWVYGLIVVVFGIIVAVAAVPRAFSARRTAALRRGLAAGRVEPAEGEVRWDGRRYLAEAAGQRLNAPYREINLPPGRYRFYVLPDTDVLISAEAIPGAAASEGGQSFVSTLASVHRFQIDALEANRQGRLAGSQSARLALALAGRLLLIVLAPGAAAAGALFLLQAAGLQEIWFWLVALAAVAGVVTLVCLWQGLWLGLDLAAGQVAVVEGPMARRISISGTGSETSVSRYYQIGQLKFNVSSRAYDVLIPGLAYRVYYTPRSKRLVAIEPV